MSFDDRVNTSAERALLGALQSRRDELKMRLEESSRSWRQAVRPRRSLALAWSTYSRSEIHPCAWTNSLKGINCVSRFWSLSVVLTLAYIPILTC